MDRSTRGNERGTYHPYSDHVATLQDPEGGPISHLAYDFPGHSPEKRQMTRLHYGGHVILEKTPGTNVEE